MDKSDGWKVLITARAFSISGQKAAALLEEAGCRVEYALEPGPLPATKLIPMLKGCDAVICSNDDYTEPIFTACPELKIVARCGVGIDSVDLRAASAAGVVATNTPGAMTDAVADYTFGLILTMARKIVDGATLMRSGGWTEYPGVLVYGKTLGLIGFGQIARGVARRAAGFDMRVLAYDPPLRAAMEAGKAGSLPGADLVERDELLEQSDYVSIHAPSLPETRGMVDGGFLSRMKSTAYLINTARGALVNESAVIAALENGTIAGAALDVFAQEPLPADHPLRRAPRCILTPHSAFNAVESVEIMAKLSAQSVIDLMNGLRPAAVCNPSVWESPALRV